MPSNCDYPVLVGKKKKKKTIRSLRLSGVARLLKTGGGHASCLRDLGEISGRKKTTTRTTFKEMARVRGGNDASQLETNASG